MAKGAGMIAPDMATMLAFVFTDAPIAAPALQAMLSKASQGSFNAITVDSDTSTSDTLLLFATGAAGKRGAPEIDTPPTTAASAPFKMALDGSAARSRPSGRARRRGRAQIRRDHGRGRGTRNAAAKRIALSIANSPLVKTAIAGEDANWGRIVAAVGKAGEKADRDRLAIWFGDIRVATKGQRDPRYDEARGLRTDEEAQDRHSRRDRPRRAGRRPSGPATSPRNMSRSTAITALEASRVKLLLVVACALIDADRRVLIAQRPEGKTLAGLWEFPGGKIDAGERPEDGADPGT